jgi:acetyl esterase/lipase
VRTESFAVTAKDGTSIELRWYTTADKDPGSAVLYAHGGGLVLGSLDAYEEVLCWYVATTRVPFLSVGYRLAPEAKGTRPASDVFAGLVWLHEHASEMNVNSARIAVMGDSGGGAPAAGAVILAREHNVPVARQILVYPMLDDRNQTPDRARVPFLTWSYNMNYTGWHALLGDQLGTDAVSPVAAPARLTNFAGLSPTYIDVGDLDISATNRSPTPGTWRMPTSQSSFTSTPEHPTAGSASPHTPASAPEQ